MKDRQAWFEEAFRQGYGIPQGANSLMRLWGVRHVRWFCLSWRVYSFADMAYQCGVGLGEPNAYDLWRIEGVRLGLL